MSTSQARFRVGQLVHHKLFDYRGVIFDVDPIFQGSDAWYESMARSRPPKDSPWYHVLVDEAVHTTYVAERNLEPDLTGQPVTHPALGQFFEGLRDGIYYQHKRAN
jgi:heat shock protein HspQ